MLCAPPPLDRARERESTMVRSAASKIAWMARATTVVIGLAIMLAFVFGVASAAFGANGDAWRLGKSNAATAVTRLGGTLGVNGPMLRLINNNADANDTALELQVQPGEAPMKVNSTSRVDLLNADLLDGLGASSFVRSGIYRKQTTAQAGNQNSDGTWSQAISCDPGDILLSGGPADVHATTDIVESFPIPNSSGTMVWTVRVQKNGVDDNWVVVALCANQ